MSHNTLILAHYYTDPKVKQMADFVGDSLELAKVAKNSTQHRIVFAGVKFMAESVKILSPNKEIILPHADSTCSLVEQTDVSKLIKFKNDNPDYLLVSYINCSAEQKAISDWIVTSANVVSIVQHLTSKGHKILFANDRNMGNYLNQQFDLGMKVWSSVCIVHDAFKLEELNKAFNEWTEAPQYLIAHPESPLPILNRANFVGSTSKMLDWIKNFPHKIGTIYVATEEGLLYDMRKIRPELDIRQAPMYSGCNCQVCPYMRLNTPELVKKAIDGDAGIVIDYLTNDILERARLPLERMMSFKA